MVPLHGYHIISYKRENAKLGISFVFYFFLMKHNAETEESLVKVECGFYSHKICRRKIMVRGTIQFLLESRVLIKKVRDMICVDTDTPSRILKNIILLLFL